MGLGNGQADEAVENVSRGVVSSDGGGGSNLVGHRGAEDREASLTPIHSSIVMAISKIMSVTEAVKKSQRNSHGGYNFSSTDDIYAALTKKMGEVGLVLLTMEKASEVVRIEATDKDGKPKISQWLKVKYQFWLATEKATWTHETNVRTLFIQVTGPQTFQAAQSFAEKSYLRSLFKIPTGDLDLDAMPQADFEDDQVALSSPSRKRKSSASAKRDGTTDEFNALRSAIQSAASMADLRTLKIDNIDLINSLPERWAGLIDDEFESMTETIAGRRSE